MMLRQTLTGRVQKGDCRSRICDSLVNVQPVLTSRDSRDSFSDQHITDLQAFLQFHLNDVVLGSADARGAVRVREVDAWPQNMFPEHEIGVRHDCV